MKRKLSFFILSSFFLALVVLGVAQAKNAPETWLGVYTQTIDEDLKEAFDLDRDNGVIIKYVVPDSPADEAGLEQGDIIIKLGDKALTNSDQLATEVQRLTPGDEVKIQIIRDGKEKSLIATLGSSDDADYSTSPKFKWYGSPPSVSKRYSYKQLDTPNKYIGVSLQNLTGQLGDYFGVSDGKGTLIAEVVEDSPAERAGLKAGDVITEVDGNPVDKISDVQKAVQNKDEGESVELTILRDKKKREIAVAVEAAPDSYGNTGMYQFFDPDDMQFFSPRMKGMFPGNWDDDDFDAEQFQESMQKMQEEIKNLQKELQDIREKMN